jgi:hypothetical protein
MIPEMVTDPFRIGGMFGSEASGKRIVVFVRCMMIFKLMLD